MDNVIPELTNLANGSAAAGDNLAAKICQDAIAEIERLKTIVDACAVSDDAPCYYCGEPVEPLAGDPGRWPLYFPQPDEPGVCKAHHVQCVLERLAEVERWRDTFGCDDPQDAVTTTAVEKAELGRRMRSINQLKAEVEELHRQPECPLVHIRCGACGCEIQLSGGCSCPDNRQHPVGRVQQGIIAELLAEIEQLKAENAELHVWREIGFALWHAASPDSDDEIGREALSRFLLAVDKQLETEAAQAAKGG